MHHFFWKISTRSETFHQTKVPEIWHNGEHPKISINPRLIAISTKHLTGCRDVGLPTTTYRSVLTTQKNQFTTAKTFKSWRTSARGKSARSDPCHFQLHCNSLSVCLPAYLPACLSTYLPAYTTHLPTVLIPEEGVRVEIHMIFSFLPNCQPACLHAFLPAYLSACLICLPTYLPACLPTYLPA